MKEFVTTLYTDERIFGGVVTGTVAALATAGVVPVWATIVTAALFTPFDRLTGKGK